MEIFKKLTLLSSFIISAASLLPAAGGASSSWWCCGSSSVSVQDSAYRLQVARTVEALDRIRALQNKPGVAPKEGVMGYSSEDFSQAVEILTSNDLLSYYLEGLDPKKHKVFVYKQGILVKGVCVFEPQIGKIHALAVCKDMQKSGIGSALVYAVMYALKKDFRKDSIELVSRYESMAFYEKLGFVFDHSLTCRRAI